MKQILVATALVAFAPVLVLAGETQRPGGPPPRGEEMLKRWDSNGDGIITKVEAQGEGADRSGSKFDRLDLDKDGQLTQDELKQGHEQRMTAMKERFDADFKSADQDGDGALSRDEAQSGMPRLVKRFDEVDANKDGAVTQEEMQAHKARRHHGKHDGKAPRSQT